MEFMENLFEDITISSGDKDIMRKKILSLIDRILRNERERFGKELLEYFQEFDNIKDKEDLSHFFDMIEEEFDINLNSIEQSM